MRHSEKAAVIALHHSKMFSQGKRNDILAQLDMLEKPCDDGENGTFRQVGEATHSDQRVANAYSLSSRTVSRYLRLHQLIPRIKTIVDTGNLHLYPTVEISYLTESEQTLLADCIEQFDFPVDMKKADMLRKYSEKRKLDSESIKRILSGAMVQKPNRTPTVKVSKNVYAKYFKPSQSAKEVQEIVEKALAMYFEHKQ
jgi:ParB family chromosome partitioning protein